MHCSCARSSPERTATLDRCVALYPSFPRNGFGLYSSAPSTRIFPLEGIYMTDDSNKISRREFTALSLAAGVTVATGAPAAAAAADMMDTDVEVKTPNGTCDAALIHPKGKGPWPGVILFVDVFGLRPTMRDMAKRLAANGYTVLVPNPYYRTSKAPGLPMELEFKTAYDRAKIGKVRAPLTDEAVMSDATANVAFFD